MHTGFCANISFHFSNINVQVCKGWVFAKCMFSFVSNWQFSSGCTILHSHQQWMRDPFLCFLLAFGIITVFNVVLICIEWCLSLILTYISSMDNGAEHFFFFHTLTCHLCLWQNIYSCLLPILWLGCLFFYCWDFFCGEIYIPITNKLFFFLLIFFAEI